MTIWELVFVRESCHKEVCRSIRRRSEWNCSPILDLLPSISNAMLYLSGNACIHIVTSLAPLCKNIKYKPDKMKISTSLKYQCSKKINLDHIFQHVFIFLEFDLIGRKFFIFLFHIFLHFQYFDGTVLLKKPSSISPPFRHSSIIVKKISSFFIWYLKNCTTFQLR